MKPKHILLTTDLSKDASRAYGPVCDLAAMTGAKITLLHVIYVLTETDAGAQLGSPIALPNYDDDRKTAAAVLEEQARELPSELDVSVRIVTGTNVARSIAQEAKELSVDLIALSTHGRSGFRRFVLGSVAEGVLRHSHLPVLCFPQESSDGSKRASISHILLTTDLSDEALRPFEPALELAGALGARVTVLNVVQELQAIPYGAALAPPIPPLDLPRDMANARCSVEEQCSGLGDGVAVTAEVISHDDSAKGIVKFAEKNAVDLIAISTHGRTGFRRLALGSVAEHVLRHSTVPVLSFPRNED